MADLGIRYADLTVNDRNPIKRMLQRRRLGDSLFALRSWSDKPDLRVLDIGCGDGELAKLLAARLNQPAITCYEPTQEFREQAEENLAGLERVNLTGELAPLRGQHFDLIFCLEVMEHLPDVELDALLADVDDLLAHGGQLIIGVPNELHLAALIKGAFRLVRRAGDYDTKPRNILRAIIGRPPSDRPVFRLAHGAAYHRRHMGFDHRALAQRLRQRFHIIRRYPSPLHWLPVTLGFEVYFLCGKPRGGQ